LLDSRIPISASRKAILIPSAFPTRSIILVVSTGRGREVGETLVRVYGSDVDEAHGVVGLKDFNWLSVLGT
jgi:hypothetical protein